jgi:hypothetical protein
LAAPLPVHSALSCQLMRRGGKQNRPKIYNDIRYIKYKWGADAIEFHDNNFSYRRNAR